MDFGGGPVQAQRDSDRARRVQVPKPLRGERGGAGWGHRDPDAGLPAVGDELGEVGALEGVAVSIHRRRWSARRPKVFSNGADSPVQEGFDEQGEGVRGGRQGDTDAGPVRLVGAIGTRVGWLRWGSPLFHVGAFVVIAGHVVGLAVPDAWTEAVGISEHAYHATAVWAGSVAGIVMVARLGMLCARRLLTRTIRRGTGRSDKLLFPLLSAAVLLGITATAAHNVFGAGYDYRSTVSVWFRGLFLLQPQPEAHRRSPCRP